MSTDMVHWYAPGMTRDAGLRGNTAAAEAYRKLTDALHRGVFTPGSRLPGERDLAVSLGVSRSTLRQALGELAQQGTLERSSQRGWFVAHHVVGEPPSTLQSFTEMARARGLTPQSRILAERQRPASFSIDAGVLQLPVR